MSGPASVYAAALRHRAELLRMERAAAAEMTRAYGQVWQELQAELEHLFARMAEAREAGEEITAGWLFERRRLETLQAQAEAEVRRFAAQAEVNIARDQQAAVRLAQGHAGELLGQAGVVSSFAQVPDAALTDLVGTLRNGSPLRTLLDELGPAASQAVREGLIQGVGAGMGSRQIARRIRGALGGDLTRALTISRTETLRSYRESTRRNYVANRDVVTGWIWMAAKDMRTCASCWAMDGTVHRLEERMSDHPNGRCAALPALRDLDVTAGRAWGADAFAEMSADQQRGVLGNAS